MADGPLWLLGAQFEDLILILKLTSFLKDFLKFFARLSTRLTGHKVVLLARLSRLSITDILHFSYEKSGLNSKVVFKAGFLWNPNIILSNNDTSPLRRTISFCRLSCSKRFPIKLKKEN